MIEIKYKFNKIDELFSIEIKSFEDCIILSEKILEDKNQIIKTFLSSNNKDYELMHDILELIENIKENGTKEYCKYYKDIIYIIVSNCLSLKNESLSSLLIQRLYRRGFVLNLVDSYIKYYIDVVDTNSIDYFDKVNVIGVNDTSLLFCCNILRYLSRYLYVEYYEEDYYLCIDSYTYYNIIRRTISHMFCSNLNVNNEWNYVGLSKLFHPLSRVYLPCLVLYLLIDELPDECRIKVLSNLSSFYCDSELIKTIQTNDVTYLAGCISRLLVYTKVYNEQDLYSVSGFLTKAITSGLSTLDPVLRESAMIIAESYSEFTFNNSENKNESLLFKFDREYKLDTPSMFNLTSFRSKLFVNPNFSKIKNNNPDLNDINRTDKLNENVENKKGEYEQDDNNNNEDNYDNETFLEFIFKGVPKIDVKTINGYVKESWIRPPQHIVQCYERLLSKPSRGDVDYECLIANNLDRIEEETVENKILRISQTLLYLPQIINKNESILEKYSIPLSNILIKLDDLDLYRDKIIEIINMNKNKRLIYEQDNNIYEGGIEENNINQYNENNNTKERGDINNNRENKYKENREDKEKKKEHNEIINTKYEFISKDPEILVLVSLVLINYYCPMNITQFYTSHLFDSEYSLGIRITMLLCIQYTAVAYNGSLDPYQLIDKIIQDTSKLSKGSQSISGLKTYNPIEDNNRDSNNNNKDRDTQILLTPTSDENIKPHLHSYQISMIYVRNFNNKVTNLLLETLEVYLKRKPNDKAPMDEDVVVGIFETLVILVSSCSIENDILKDLDEIVQYFISKPIGQRLRSTLDMVSMILSTVTNPRICI